MEPVIDETLPILKFSVTCHTKKCENGEIVIDIQTRESEPVVICGVCSKKITDITAVAEPKSE